MGISKNGFGSSLGVLVAPLLLLVIPQSQAAVMLLPLLYVMEIINCIFIEKLIYNLAYLSLFITGIKLRYAGISST